MQVSVIIPAYNAEDTILDTLQSLVDQTFPHWEAIVIDDGSTDATSTVVSNFIGNERRFRLVRQENKGESEARNSGIKLARFDWLLFLDSDDWILPQHLERLTSILEAKPDLDAAYCGWTYVTPDDQFIFGSPGKEEGDLFAQHAGYCFSVVHTYLVRHAVVQAAGGFDLSLRTCADWDLWQRIARTGARFGVAPEILAVYRIRAGSATRDGHQLLKDGLSVITRGHASDPRVLKPHPLHVNGEPKETLSERKFELACACAGYLIGGGRDGRPLLALLEGERCSHLDIYSVVSCLFRHTMISSSRPLSEWHGIWPNFIQPIDEFLVALESASGTSNLAHRARLLLKHLINSCGTGQGLVSRGQTINSGFMLAMYQKLPYYYRFTLRVARRVVDRSMQLIPERTRLNLERHFPVLKVSK
jgi:hypothetical protein